MKNVHRSKSEPILCNAETHCSSPDDSVSDSPTVCNGNDTNKREDDVTSTDSCDSESQYVALDCEFVGVGPKQSSALGMFALLLLARWKLPNSNYLSVSNNRTV